MRRGLLVLLAVALIGAFFVGRFAGEPRHAGITEVSPATLIRLLKLVEPSNVRGAVSAECSWRKGSGAPGFFIPGLSVKLDSSVEVEKFLEMLAREKWTEEAGPSFGRDRFWTRTDEHIKLRGRIVSVGVDNLKC